ncbi:hypothetical protein BLNAU_13650 [Blattamonas nauphoetae]|uniref:Uncharacterized protein n=1 Tax=Blattamonas nauphoetae TaxID=2049346 RepID=A0ABQ9XMK9_9EUKA|nr:hypothetical protein BLNAU_13650 [Blattamonas nauphoetae]
MGEMSQKQKTLKYGVLVSLLSSISTNPKAHVLNLHNRNLVDIPHIQFPHVETFHLTQNLIQSITHDLSKLFPHLRTLNIAKNQFVFLMF